MKSSLEELKSMKLGLEEALPKPARMSLWPLFDLCAIGLFFALFSSKFIVTPGISLDLPRVKNSQVALAERYDVATISEVNGEEMVFFRDSVLDLEGMRKVLEENPEQDRATLLVKADQRVSMKSISSLIEIAMTSGYSNVQLATEESRSAGSGFINP